MLKNKEIALFSVLLVEDYANSREHTKDILSLYFQNVYTAENGCQGLEIIETEKPDIIITDIKMPCLDGIEMIQKGKEQGYDPVVIITTAFSDKEYLLSAIDMKIDAYLIKPINISLLLEKIEESLPLKSDNYKDLRYKKLSAREYEVFLDLAKGLKAAEIAAKYNIKPKTISTYRNRIFEKMSFSNNADLVVYAIKNNLI